MELNRWGLAPQSLQLSTFDGRAGINSNRWVLCRHMWARASSSPVRPNRRQAAPGFQPR